MLRSSLPAAVAAPLVFLATADLRSQEPQPAPWKIGVLMWHRPENDLQALAGLEGALRIAGRPHVVFVEDADGRRIPWSEVSRIDENEMRTLMQEIVNRLYTFHLEADDPKLQATIDRWMGPAMKWDEPAIDPSLSGRGRK